MAEVPRAVARREEREMRYEEFEVMQTRFNDLDRRLQLILLGWVVSIVAFMVGLRLLTANAALLSVIR